MDPSPGIVSFADLLTPTGVLIAAAAVVSLVEILKAALPALDARVSGATLAFVLSAFLYVATAVAIRQETPDGYLVVVFAWISCATSAMGIRAGADHVSEVRAGTAGEHPADVVVEHEVDVVVDDDRVRLPGDPGPA